MVTIADEWLGPWPTWNQFASAVIIVVLLFTLKGWNRG
jgi:hypothetical protein